MPYLARTQSLSDEAVHGGLIDPRAEHQATFGKRIQCRDLTAFVSSLSKTSPLMSKLEPVFENKVVNGTVSTPPVNGTSHQEVHPTNNGPNHGINGITSVPKHTNNGIPNDISNGTNGTTIFTDHESNHGLMIDEVANGTVNEPASHVDSAPKVNGLANGIASGNGITNGNGIVNGNGITHSLTNGTTNDNCTEPCSPSNRKSTQRHPLSDLIPGSIGSGGLSRSPAFDALPVVSHWGDRTNESSREDPNATFLLSSTWETAHVFGEGTQMNSPFGAPAWSLKSHTISTAEVGSAKFAQNYDSSTDTLVTKVNLEHRTDTPRTAGVIGTATMISWARNTRVADAVDCAVGLLSNASKLLHARDQMITTGKTQYLEFAEVRPGMLPDWCAARKPLPPKLSGVAISQDKATVELLAKEGSEGPMLNTSIFSMAVGYNRGVYGGSISGLWAVMDSSFVLDYSIGKQSTAMGNSLSSAFIDVADAAESSTFAGPHITDIRIVKGCNYGSLRQKTNIEDNHPLPSKPCIVVWNDLAQLARYKLADAVFCHVYYDAGGGEQMAAIAGLGCVAHDWIDLGADVACGEVSNIIPSLTRGSLEEDVLAEVYAPLVGAMIWYRDNDPYNPAALCLLFTHWWQLANCRHRPITLLGRTDLDINAAITAITPSTRPDLEHFRASGTPVAVERGQKSLNIAEGRLASLLASNPLPETHAVINLLVQPVLEYVKGGQNLPMESEYIGAVLAAEVAYPQGQKILELWDLAIVMWECGAMWAAGVAGLCYTHTGKSNCDRARQDLADTTWT